MNKHYVLRLDISVQDLELVHKIDSVKKIAYNEGGCFF